MGGPILNDRPWLRGELQDFDSEHTGNSRPTVINGEHFNNSNRPFPNSIGYLKFSSQLTTTNLRASVMGQSSMEDVPHDVKTKGERPQGPPPESGG